MKRLRLWISLVAGFALIGAMMLYLARQGVFKSTSAPLSAVPEAELSVTGAPAGVRSIKPFAAKAFALKDPTGKEWTAAGLKGKPVLLHFWATWCPPCVEEIPAILKFAERMKGTDLQVVAVSLDSDWETAHKIFPVTGLPSNLISLIDPKQATPESYGSFQFPESYLIDRGMRVVAKWVGIQKWELPFYADAVEQVLATSPQNP